MTPTELRVQALKKIEALIVQYMDGVISGIELQVEADEALDEMVAQFGDL